MTFVVLAMKKKKKSGGDKAMLNRIQKFLIKKNKLLKTLTAKVG